MASLIYHSGALGDFLTAVPALRYWKNRHKSGHPVLLGRPPIGELAKNCGLIDDVFDVESTRFLPLFSENLTPEMEKFLSSFKAAVLFATPGSPLPDAVKRCGIPAVYWQPPFPSSRIHAVDYHLSLFTDPSTVPDRDKIPTVTPSDRATAAANDILSPSLSPVAIHPGSGSRKKNWPLERFILLAGALRKRGMPLLWLLGPAEENIDVPGQDIVIAHQPLDLCAALLSRCRAFVGNDSGMAHLAAAVGCPAVAIFGPSDPAVWAPRGRDVRILYKKNSCSPCHRQPYAPPTCRRSCMTAITVGEVIDAVGEFISPATGGKAGRTCARQKNPSSRPHNR